MTSKNLKKYINDNVKEYYHSSGLYNSLIYKKISRSNNLSKEQSLEKNFSKIRITLEKFIDNKNDLIPSNFKTNSKIMVIGDMPSLNDHNNKNIFSDHSGELLKKMLKAISINIEDVYLTNILPFFSKEQKNIYNNFKAFLKKSIKEHISIIDPQIILLLGSVPMEILFDDEFSIYKNRGQWINFKSNNKNIFTLCTFHPNFLIQQPNQKKNAWLDLQLFQEKLKDLI